MTEEALNVGVRDQVERPRNATGHVPCEELGYGRLAPVAEKEHEHDKHPQEQAWRRWGGAWRAASGDGVGHG